MDSYFFCSFSNINLIVWLNVFTSQKFLNIVIVFKHCIATMMLLFKSIAKYGNLSFQDEKASLLAQVLRKQSEFWGREQSSEATVEQF